MLTLETDPAAALAAVAAVGGWAEGEVLAWRCSTACLRPNTHATSAYCAVYSTQYGCSHG